MKNIMSGTDVNTCGDHVDAKARMTPDSDIETRVAEKLTEHESAIANISLPRNRFQFERVRKDTAKQIIAMIGEMEVDCPNCEGKFQSRATDGNVIKRLKA